MGGGPTITVGFGGSCTVCTGEADVVMVEIIILAGFDRKIEEKVSGEALGWEEEGAQGASL
jgi:hypothetical protein